MNRYILSFLFLGLFSLCVLGSAAEAQAFSFFFNNSDDQKSDDHDQSSSEDSDAEEEEEDEDDDDGLDMTDDPLEDLDDEFMDGGY